MDVKSNHDQAPQAAEFVAAMREAFGADHVKVLWVKEGEFTLGEKEAWAKQSE